MKLAITDVVQKQLRSIMLHKCKNLVTTACRNRILQSLTTVLIFLFPSTTRIRHLCSVGSGGCGLPSLGFGLVLPSSKSYKNHFTTTGLLSPNIADYRTSTGVEANQVSYQIEKSVSPWPQTQRNDLC